VIDDATSLVDPPSRFRAIASLLCALAALLPVAGLCSTGLVGGPGWLYFTAFLTVPVGSIASVILGMTAFSGVRDDRTAARRGLGLAMVGITISFLLLSGWLVLMFLMYVLR
jgi:hypothetical protein